MTAPDPADEVLVQTQRDSITLLGAGGHALVVAFAAREARLNILGAYDDDPSAPAFSGVDPIERLGKLCDAPNDRPWILAIGSLGARRALIDHLGTDQAASVVHPSAVVAPDATIGPGVFIGPRAVVHPRAVVGAHAIINTGAIIEHECTIGENTHVAPGAVLCGNAAIGRDTLVGAGSTLIPGVTIGDSCVVGAGSVVLRDIDHGATAVGSPARVLANQG